MSHKILLINFSKADTKLIEQAIPFKVISGYLDIDGTIISPDGKERLNIQFYSPEAYYECSLIIINLDKNGIQQELASKARSLDEDEWQDFKAYWKKTTNVMVVYFSDTPFGSLFPIGIPLGLKSTKNRDTVTKMTIDEEYPLHGLVKFLQGQIKLPASHLIESVFDDNNNLYRFGTDWHTLLRNHNNDNVVSTLSKETSDFRIKEPGVLLLPLPKSISKTTVKIVDFFTQYYELPHNEIDWVDSDDFYPSLELGKLNKELIQIVTDYEKKTSDKKEQIVRYKDNYQYLKTLVTGDGDDLVDAVFKCLNDVIGLDVTKSDDEEKPEEIEDLLIKVNGMDIVTEVKGTNSVNPPLDYPSQPIRHISRRGYGKDAEGCLILNHDKNRPPAQRKPAYIDSDKQPLIKDIYFIDTRVLLDVVKAVIDKRLSKDAAIKILFGAKERAIYPKPKKLDDK